MKNPPSDTDWMQHALASAQKAANIGEVPVGAVIVQDHQLISSAHNRSITDQDPSAHAEIVALRQAAYLLKNYRLPNTTLYVTIEPCLMCVGALSHARVKRVVFGCREPKAGAIVSQLHVSKDLSYLNHRFDWTEGILETQCQQVIQAFFQAKRKS